MFLSVLVAPLALVFYFIPNVSIEELSMATKLDQYLCSGVKKEVAIHVSYLCAAIVFAVLAQ